MAVKVFLLIVIQLHLAVAQSNITTTEGSAHNRLTRDFEVCQIQQGWINVLELEVSKQLSGSPLTRIENLTDLWTSHCDGFVEDIINDDINPLENLRNSVSHVKITHTNITEFKSGYFCQFNNLWNLLLDNNRLNDTYKIGINGNNECSRKYCFNYLRFLSLSGNPLRVIKNNSFCGLDELTNLDLDNCELYSIESGAFLPLTRLSQLNLTNNHLNRLPSQLFRSNPNLWQLYMSFNNFSAVPDIQNSVGLGRIELNNNVIKSVRKFDFFNCTRLSWINVSHNVISSIEDGAFDIVNQIRFLDLNNNRLKTFDEKLFSNPSIKELFMAFNKLDAVPDIQNSVSIGLIELSNNVIKSVRKFDFFNCTRLSKIYLSHNKIRSIEDGAFDGGYELEVLDLSNNRLQKFDEKLFSLNIKALFLNNNRLKRLSLGDLGFHIRELHLKGNRISRLISNRLDQHSLSLLDLTNNNLTRLFELFLPNSVETIILDNNSINRLSFSNSLVEQIVAGKTSLQEVSLKNNSFDYVPLWTYHCKQGRIFGPYYYFDGNPLKCVCENTWFLEASIVNFIPTGLSCQLPAEITAKHLYPKTNVLSTNQLCESSYNNSNRCRFYHETILSSRSMSFCPIRLFRCYFKCPPPCHCYTTLNYSVAHLYCSNTQLRLIPQSFDNEKLSSESEVILWLDGNNINTINSTDFDNFVNVMQLYLNRSRIHNIDQMAFNGLKVLRVLNLNDNDLQSLPLGLFDDVIVLQELYLANNQLSHLSDDMIKNLLSLQMLHLHKNHFSDYPVWNLKNVLSLKEVTLHENIWTCECSFVMKFRDYLIHHAKSVYNASLIYCIDQDELSTTTSILNFDTSVCSFVGKVIMWSTIGSACVLLIISVLVSYLYRRELQLLIYSRVRRRVLSGVDDSEGKLFDVFVAYSNDDFHFMYHNLLPGLEGIPNPYRVCVHERDFLAGCVIADNILEAVRISSRTIILLTDNFVRSGWCRFEFKAAHLQMLEDRCPRVLVIVVGKIPANIEPEMMLYLKTNTYLTWGEAYFWQKLHDAMPKQRATGVGVARSPNLMPLDLEIESSF